MSAAGARAAVFAQLEDTGRAEQVAQRLTDAILLGVFAPGERLPREAELAKRFGVALVTAREGLGTLRQNGLVETRRGRDGGSFVLAGPERATAALRSRLHRLPQVDVADFGAYFGVLAAGAVERAAERAAPPDGQRLQAWVRTADFDSATGARRSAGGFHLEIAVLSQSARLVREQIRVQAEFGPLLWWGLQETSLRARTREADLRIAEAVTRHDADTAYALVRGQVATMTGWLLTAKNQLDRDRPPPGGAPQGGAVP